MVGFVRVLFRSFATYFFLNRLLQSGNACVIKIIMKLVFISLLLSVCTLPLFAQEEMQVNQQDPGRLRVNTNRLYGKLISSNTEKPVDAASVQLFIVNDNGKDSLVRGMLTKPNGDFAFTDLPADSFRLVLTAMGYEPVQMQMSFTDYAGTGKYFNKDLGNINLSTAIKQLTDVVVTSTRPVMELGVDRKVYNASKTIVAAGGTAVDLMKNIPSLSVDVEGNVQLRNSAPQIFVDGRPTILSLKQIPAENIEKVELITNPSAKFDAASSGGIINIILKKNKRIGLNGIASIGAGLPGIANSNLNLNVRQGKINLFASGGYNISGGVSRSETKRQNKQNGLITDYFNQYSDNDRRRRFASVRFGIDYFIDNRNTLSVTQQIGGGRFSYKEAQQQDFLDNLKQPVYYGERNSDGISYFNRNSSALYFTHKFPKDGR